MRALLAILLVLVVAPLWAAPVTQTQLPNGLQLVTLPDSSTDLVGIHLAIKVSAAQEPAETKGIRALLHQQATRLMAERVTSEPELELIALSAKRPEAAAPTSVEWDFVEATLCVPATELQKALELFAQVLYTAEITDDRLKETRDEVLKQRAQLAGGGLQGAFLLFRAALLDSASDLDAIYGSPKTLRDITIEQVRAFRSRYYTARNTSICIVGAVSPAEAEAAVTKAFGSLPAGEATDWKPTLPATEAPRTKIAGAKGLGQALIVAGVATPPATDPSFVTALVVNQILGGPEGRIERDQTLIETLGLEGVRPQSPEGGGAPVGVMPLTIEAQPYLALWAVAEPREIEAVRKRLLERIGEFDSGGMPPQELATARRAAATALATQLSMPQSCAAFLNRWVLFGADPQQVALLPQQADAVTSQQILVMAARWFGPSYVGVQMPQ
jgi:predicted Zn-dependent peptidase